MDREEARSLIVAELARYRSHRYDELQRLLRVQDTYRVTGLSGKEYQVEIQAVWDGPRGGNLRVMASIDDGGIRAFFPLTEDFIVAPSGAFVGE